MRSYDFTGFPVIQEEMFLGFVGREKLGLTLGLPRLSIPPLLKLMAPTEQLLGERSPTELARECTFSHTDAGSDPDLIDLSSLMEVSVLELRTEVPLELVVNTIQKMVRPFPFHSPTAQQDVRLLTELTANTFHAGREAHGFDYEIRYRRFINSTPAA